MEREDERGTAKRPDLNELDVPECAELALDDIAGRKLLQHHTALWGWRQRAAGAEQAAPGGGAEYHVRTQFP
jgi:hypothetical protein